jgi:putative heme uptake system protein
MSEPAPSRRLLVWDAPNIDSVLGTVLGGRAPLREERPRFDVLARWLVERLGEGEVPEACVFSNIPTDGAERLRGWVDALRNTGYSVFLKPKIESDDDIDEDLLAHVLRREREGPIAELILASNDQYREFEDDLTALAQRLPLTVLGFREFSSAAMRTDVMSFIDLEDIPGLFETTLEREPPLDRIPAEGAWLAPRQSLTDLYAAGAAVRPV